MEQPPSTIKYDLLYNTLNPGPAVSVITDLEGKLLSVTSQRRTFEMGPDLHLIEKDK